MYKNLYVRLSQVFKILDRRERFSDHNRYFNNVENLKKQSNTASEKAISPNSCFNSNNSLSNYQTVQGLNLFIWSIVWTPWAPIVWSSIPFAVKIKTRNVSLNQPNSNPSSIGSNRRSLPPSYDAMFGSKTTVESIFKNDSFRNSKQASFDDEAESVKGLSDWTELSPNSGLVNPCLSSTSVIIGWS